MGVRGFLISWAMRRATSRQAAMRWAFSRSVKSSRTTTTPMILVLVISEHGDFDEENHGAIADDHLDLLFQIGLASSAGSFP